MSGNIGDGRGPYQKEGAKGLGSRPGAGLRRRLPFFLVKISGGIAIGDEV